MADERTEGTRLAGALADRLTDAERFDGLAVTGERAVEPTADGAFAYAVTFGEAKLAAVFVYPDRARVEFRAAPDEAATAATDADLRVRPKATRPPRTLVFVESTDEVERALDVIATVVETTD